MFKVTVIPLHNTTLGVSEVVFNSSVSTILGVLRICWNIYRTYNIDQTTYVDGSNYITFSKNSQNLLKIVITKIPSVMGGELRPL